MLILLQWKKELMCLCNALFLLVPQPTPIFDKHPFCICTFSFSISYISLLFKRTNPSCCTLLHFLTNISTFSNSNSGDGVGWCCLIPVSPCVPKTNCKLFIHFAYNRCFFDRTLDTLCTAWNKSRWTWVSFPNTVRSLFLHWQQLSMNISLIAPAPCRL